MGKIRVAVLFGGTNTEHEVSLVSAQAIIENLDPVKYVIIPIKITKENRWIKPKELHASYQKVISSNIASAEQSIDSVGEVMEGKIDVVFPVIHGPYGEDGTIQGMLELMRIPYVGSGVTGSAVCMDKVVQKNICASYGIPVTPYFWFTKGEWDRDQSQIIAKIEEKLDDSYPLFVKPANQGSSVGVTKAHNKKELIEGIEQALTRDTKVLVEIGVQNAREIECSIIGRNDDPQASVLGEIIPGNEFYDFEAKYLGNNSDAIIPADLSENLAVAITSAAKTSFRALDCSGLARVDFLLNQKTGDYFLNEVNTMPGFTPISMFPKLWAASGLPYKELLSKLIDLAVERSKERRSINLSR